MAVFVEILGPALLLEKGGAFSAWKAGIVLIQQALL